MQNQEKIQINDDVEDAEYVNSDIYLKNKFRYYLGITLLSLLPSLIFIGQIFPEFIKRRPALLFFISEMLMISSVIIFISFVFIPICIRLIRKLDVNKKSFIGSIIPIKEIFVFCIGWFFILYLIGHFTFDLNLYKETQKSYINEVSEILQQIKSKNNSQDKKDLYKKITILSYKKFLSLPIPDDLVNNNYEKVFKSCKLDEFKLITDICGGDKISSSFKIDRFNLFKHLFYQWKPELPFMFIDANNNFSKQLIIKDIFQNKNIQKMINNEINKSNYNANHDNIIK